MRKQTKLVAVLSAAALLAIGASMTSFAKGWTMDGDDWVYLDNDGERVTQEWKKSGNDYYWLDDEGLMATDTLVDDDDDIYYVNSEGVRVKNAWIALENEDNTEVNGEEVGVLYYYFGENGKAYRADSDNFKKRTVDYAGGKGIFFFDSEGHMASGWIDYTADGKTYYCGTEEQGWARTGWQYLEPKSDLEGEDYDDMEWFNFDGNGKMRQGEVDNPKSWYSNGKYYIFDENGVMQDDWYTMTIASNTLGVGTPGDPTSWNNGAASTLVAYKGSFTTYVGTNGTGWVYTEDADEYDYYWYYLVTFRDAKGTVRNMPFNSQAPDDEMRAKVIGGKTYLFDSEGKMQDGLVELDHATPKDNEGGASSKSLAAGVYYFNDSSASVKGQMVTGKQAVTKDGETNYYYFDKSTGRALTNIVKDGVVYGDDGKRVQAEDGNSNEIRVLEKDTVYSKGTADIDNPDYDPDNSSSPATVKGIKEGSTVIVSSTGKLRTSGVVKVDGVKYKVITGEVWRLEEQDS